jgi:O-antigen ligase
VPVSSGIRGGNPFAILCGAALLVPVVFIVGSPVVPIVLRSILVGLWLIAVVRPHAALIGLVLLVPFASSLLVAFGAPPMQYAEALVLATLSGALIAADRTRGAAERSLSPSLAAPAAVFGGVVICSLAVGLAVSQVGLGIRWHFVRDVATFLVRDYLIGPPDQRPGITAAALLVEGVVLLLVVVHRTRQAPSRPLQVISALAVSGAVASAMALAQMAMSISGANSFRDVWATLVTSRIGAHINDANAAGSFYAMTVCVVLGLALNQGTRGSLRRVWAVIATALLLALGLTGSRAAVVSIVTVFILAGASAARRGSRQWPRWWVAAAGAACVLTAIAVGFDPRAVARRSLLQALDERAAFVITGLRIMAAAPVFGIGVGRYFEVSGGFMPQSIYWFHLRENAHNNFLQIGGELGLAGLVAYVWLLAASAVRLARGWLARPSDRLLAGALAGLAAFVVSWMAGHPMLTPEVAFPFWILLGASIARADGNNTGPALMSVSDDKVPGTIGYRARYTAGIALLALLAMMPLRVEREASALNLAGQSFGFHDWEGDPAKGRFRWTNPSAAFFVPGQISEVDVPLSAAFADRRREPTMVTMSVDGVVAQKLQLKGGRWMVAQLRLPKASKGQQYRRIDILTAPPWSPAVVLGTQDARVLGIQVGEVTMR